VVRPGVSAIENRWLHYRSTIVAAMPDYAVQMIDPDVERLKIDFPD
jgi:hypothetical protein